MKGCGRKKMNQKSILLAIVILITCSLGESEGFFLKNFLSETKLEEPEVSATILSAETISTDTTQVPFDEIHQNVSENVDKPSTTQIINSVKDIVNLVLDEHISDNRTQHKLPEENNQIDVELKKNTVNVGSDISSLEALSNFEHDSKDLAVNIVKIPEADNKDIATALEDNIRSSVKDEIQLEQNFESTIDVIDGIPDPEVRQTLTEDFMAIEYPQSVKKLEQNSDESKPVITRKEEDNLDSTETVIEVTTEPTLRTLRTTSIPKELDSIDSTTVIALETDVVTDVESTTANSDIFQDITLIPSEEIVHSVEELQDTDETNPIRTRQKRGLNEESGDDDSSEGEASNSSDDQKSSKSKSSNSSDLSNSSSSSGEDYTYDNGYTEKSGKNASLITQKPVSQPKVKPTPRPRIRTTTEITLKATTDPEGTNPILVEGVTESTGSVVFEEAVTIGDRKHTVIKKPGVEEDLSLPNITGKSVLTDVSSEGVKRTVNNFPEVTTEESKLEEKIEADALLIVPSTDIVEASQTLISSNLSGEIINEAHEKTVLTENHLIKPVDPLIPSENHNFTQEVKIDDLLDSGPRSLKEIIDNNTEQTESVPLENSVFTQKAESNSLYPSFTENVPKMLTETSDNNTEQDSITDVEETLIKDTESKTNQTNDTNTKSDKESVLIKDQKPNTDQQISSLTDTSPKPTSSTLLPQTVLSSTNQSSSPEVQITESVTRTVKSHSEVTEESKLVEKIEEDAVPDIPSTDIVEAGQTLISSNLSGEIINAAHEKTVLTENHLIKPEDPPIPSENHNFTQEVKIDDLLESDPRSLKEIYDNNTEQAESVPLENSIFTQKVESNSLNPSFTENVPKLLTETSDNNTEQDSIIEGDKESVLIIDQKPDTEQQISTQPGTSPKPSSSTLSPQTVLSSTTQSSSLELQITPGLDELQSSQTPFFKSLLQKDDDATITSTEASTYKHIEEPSLILKKYNTNGGDLDTTNKLEFNNKISKHIDETPEIHAAELSSTTTNTIDEQDTYETSTERPTGRSNEDSMRPAVVNTLIEAAELTTEFARHVDSFRTTGNEVTAISEEIVPSASAGRSFNAITAEGLGKPLPTRSVGDEPSTSSYSSEDKTTTVVVLCSAAAAIFIAFSVAIYLITFQRQHGTLDIEMQEQHCGKDDLEDDTDAETRVTLLNQLPQVDSDEQSSD